MLPNLPKIHKRRTLAVWTAVAERSGDTAFHSPFILLDAWISAPAHCSQSGVAADSATAIHKRGQKLFNCDPSVNRDVPEGLSV